MPIITDSALKSIILDKMARWAVESVGDDSFGASFDAGMAAANANIMSGSNSIATALAALAATDMDPPADMLAAARNLDESNPEPPSRFMIQIPDVAALFTAVNNHIKRYNPATATLDAYLTTKNSGATPDVRVHQAVHDHLKAFSRVNVFIGADQVLATFAATGATTGTFTSVSTISLYAGAQIKVKNQGAVTTGATLSVVGKKLDGTSATVTATIATGTDNFETALSSTAKLFVQITGISITGGTNANIYEIVAKTDRDITAA